MKTPSFVRSLGPGAAALALTLAAGCSALLPKPPLQPSFYALDGAAAGAPAAPREASIGAVTAATLVVNPPQAGAGFDSRRIIYVRKAHQLEYYAHSEWVDTPARMLAPLIVAALDRSGAFRAVVSTPSAAAGDLRLDTEIVRLQHEFGGAPSRVRLTLRATLTDNATRQVLARHDFDAQADAGSEDAYGGVVAANHATRQVLQALAAFCSQAAQQWQPRAAGAARPAVGRL